MTKEIVLRNENGKIVGYDGDGNRVPVKFEEGEFESVSTERIRNLITQFQFNNTPSRDLVSREPIELYLDPDGSDDAAGTQSDPIYSFQEVFNRLPHIIQHKTRIYVANGSYLWVGNVPESDDDNPPGSAPHLMNYRGPENFFEMVGDPDNPSNVEITGGPQLNFAFIGGHPYRCVIQGMDINAKIVNYHGGLSIQDCILHSDDSLGTVAAVDGYAGFTSIRNCTFVSPAVHAARAFFGHRIHIENCNGAVSGPLYVEERGGIVTRTNNSIRGLQPEVRPETTNVQLELTTDLSISSGEWTTIPFHVAKNDRGEWDSTGNCFSPDTTKTYSIGATAGFESSEGDDIEIKFYDTVTGTPVIRERDSADSVYQSTISISRTVELDESNTYEIQVRNLDSDDTVLSNAGTTVGSIIDSGY
ncbi:hypothetical protein [Halorubellus salinus]|uniref:hypothetical protein n=1 Tax=Halorubellus salinus TaxID=755309 RepID=UPI001D05CEB1|nr:hypothetical protein [Halorubellus salinus]